MEETIQIEQAIANVQKLVDNIETVIKGKRSQIQFVLTALLAKGHVLMEDNPGTGKTVMAKTLAQSISNNNDAHGILFKRIQFTPDLLPMDLIGSHIFDDIKKEFVFKKGPLFCNFLLADEINRASPKVQSALLECMAENQITIGETTYPLEKLFFTIATQNPIEMEGTYPLPSAQLDRFYIKIYFGYVDEATELNIYKDYLGIQNSLNNVKQVLTLNEILFLQNEVEKVLIHEEIIVSVRNIVRETRKHSDIILGAWSNYANMEHEAGDFADAIENYSKQRYEERFSLSEPNYYKPMLLVYGGQTKEAIKQTQHKIEESGSIPGFGWYSIALARSYIYDGQLDSCDFYLKKAENFKELHINTTLTQSQYEFTINLLRVQLIEKKVALIKFFNKGWWYSLSDIYDVLALKTEKMLLEYALVNELANNPERTRIVYDLFCSETTVSFDESMYLLKDFCLPYFEQKYKNYTKTDKRRKINRYFRLFASRFEYENGETEKAKRECEILLKETIPFVNSDMSNENLIDVEHEKLYTYRLLELLAKTSNEQESIAYKNACFEVYPQLMLFSSMTTRMNISFSGLQDDEIVQAVVSDLKDCDIEFTNGTGVPKVNLQFLKKGATYQVIINVRDKNNKSIVTNGELIFKQEKGIGKELAMRLFGKGGAVKFENPIN